MAAESLLASLGLCFTATLTKLAGSIDDAVWLMPFMVGPGRVKARHGAVYIGLFLCEVCFCSFVTSVLHFVVSLFLPGSWDATLVMQVLSGLLLGGYAVKLKLGGDGDDEEEDQKPDAGKGVRQLLIVGVLGSLDDMCVQSSLLAGGVLKFWHMFVGVLCGCSLVVALCWGASSLSLVVRAVDKVPFHVAMYAPTEQLGIATDDLSSLAISVFHAYSDRPCVGCPVDGGGWKWRSYEEILGLSRAYDSQLQGFDFVVASFERNCPELVALDVAALLQGLPSVVVQGKEQLSHVLALLGAERCCVIAAPPSGTAPAVPALAWRGDDSEALFSLFCTSGSTGVPKLVRRSRAAWKDNMEDTAPYGAHLCVTLAFASLAHSGPRTELWWNLACGGQTAFRDDAQPVLEALSALSPTEIAAPPCVWAELRQSCLKDGVTKPHQLKKKYPGLVRHLQSASTGSARCEPALLEFLHNLFDVSVSVADNYGTTEVGAIATDGVVNFGVDARLEDVPELGFVFPRGEICVRCPGGFEGYHGNAEATARAVTGDGYYRTGDLGEQVRPGVIRILERREGVVKLADGKFHSLEQIEARIAGEQPEIEQVCALEHEGQVILVVHAPALPDPLPHLGFACVRAAERFSPANGMLTPSLKLCRRNVRLQHASLFPQSPVVDAVTKVVVAVKQRASELDGAGLAELGLQSVQWAQLARELCISVHAVAAAVTISDLRSRLQLHSDNFAKEALRDFEHQCRALAAEQTAQQPPLPYVEWRAVLVTGATGHIGAHAAEQLRVQGLHVVEASRSLGYDLSKPLLGLPAERYAALVAECDAVVHCAAIVNWSLPYAALRGSNVLGTCGVVRFCNAGDRRKPLLMVSSGAAWPERPVDLQWLTECANPYMCTKLVAEAIATRFCPEAVVVRPAMVVWHSATGRCNPDDAVSRLVRAFLEDGLAWEPEPGDELLDGMNVDSFCTCALEAWRRGGPAVYSFAGAFPMAKLLEAIEPPVRRVKYSEWRLSVERSCSQNPRHPLASLLPHLDAAQPPLTAPPCSLSAACRHACGEQAAALAHRTCGFTAFVQQLSR